MFIGKMWDSSDTASIDLLECKIVYFACFCATLSLI